MGTAAHSWVMSFDTETEAFAELQRLLGDHTVQLIDTYDPVEGARVAARLGRTLVGRSPRQRRLARVVASGPPHPG